MNRSNNFISHNEPATIRRAGFEQADDLTGRQVDMQLASHAEKPSMDTLARSRWRGQQGGQERGQFG
ncbi:MAG: hypothetical protein HY360_04555 [Verrucomicrobia bacterium]|nr:hypothetical protein [Verrucomicrobiota bacterium]